MLAINKKLRLYKIWTKEGGIVLFSMLFCVRLRPDGREFREDRDQAGQRPDRGVDFSDLLFVWFSMKQAWENDARIAAGGRPREAEDSKEKILVWPDLVYIEFIALILCTVLLIVWSIVLQRPAGRSPRTRPCRPTPRRRRGIFEVTGDAGLF